MPNTQNIEAIEKVGLDSEGIYRLSGTASKIQQLKSLLISDPSFIIDDSWPIDDITGALKSFLRQNV